VGPHHLAIGFEGDPYTIAKFEPKQEKKSVPKKKKKTVGKEEGGEPRQRAEAVPAGFSKTQAKWETRPKKPGEARRVAPKKNAWPGWDEGDLPKPV